MLYLSIILSSLPASNPQCIYILNLMVFPHSGMVEDTGVAVMSLIGTGREKPPSSLVVQYWVSRAYKTKYTNNGTVRDVSFVLK
jgi:hypothetical protein